MIAPVAPEGRTRNVAALLTGLAAAMVALAVFQWLELVHVRQGGAAVCSVNATINCETVWNSAFASRVHRWLGVPVAALGLVWGLTALVLALRLLLRTGDLARRAAVRLTGAAGAAGCVVFIFASFQSGALCLTCLGTYVLVLAFMVVAFAALPQPWTVAGPELRSAVLWPLGLAVGFYVLALAPGHATPTAASEAKELARAAAPSTTAQGAPAVSEDPHTRLVTFLGRIPHPEAQALSDTLAAYRASVVPMQAFGFTTRALTGPATAPMKVVEFTDILCSHCKHLEEAMRELRRMLPPGAMSVEARYFPLDGECNPSVQHVSGDGVRCAGAKAQLCLEGAPDFLDLREKMFAEQESLTVQRVMDIAASGSVSKAQIESCMNSPETTRKLEEDVRYAILYNLQGTPLVLVNGKEGSPMPSFLYAMALTGGNANAPEFSVLPPPSRAATP